MQLIRDGAQKAEVQVKYTKIYGVITRENLLTLNKASSQPTAEMMWCVLIVILVKYSSIDSLTECNNWPFKLGNSSF